jgi:hypothetical protein
MRKLTTALCVALFALSGTASYAADPKKAEPAKPTSAKPADKAASAAPAATGGANKPAAATSAEPKKEKKAKKGGCCSGPARRAVTRGRPQAFPVVHCGLNAA